MENSLTNSWALAIMPGMKQHQSDCKIIKGHLVKMAVELKNPVHYFLVFKNQNIQEGIPLHQALGKKIMLEFQNQINSPNMVNLLMDPKLKTLTEIIIGSES